MRKGQIPPKNLPREERQERVFACVVALQIKSQRRWTMQRLGKEIGVSGLTVSRWGGPYPSEPLDDTYNKVVAFLRREGVKPWASDQHSRATSIESLSGPF